MEAHPEQYSDGARLEIRRKIHLAYSRVGHDLYELAHSLLDLRPADSILDVGCGLGDFLVTVRNHGHLGRLAAIDQSPDIVEKARKAVSRLGFRADIKIGSAETLEFPAASFDCVTALHVLSKAVPGKVLSEIGRVLKADGRVIVSTNSRMSYPLLEELKSRARERFGWFLANEWLEGFDSESAQETLKQYFGQVAEFRYEDVLQYPDAEILVELFRSTRGLWNEKITEAEWERIVDWARDQALELIPERGYAEDPKTFSLFRCTAALGL